MNTLLAGAPPAVPLVPGGSRLLEALPLLTPGDMRRTEAQAFARGVPSLLLMEHAAQAVTDALEKALGGCRGNRVLFLCGPGNNGGDGLAAARLFRQRGGLAEIWLSGAPKTPEARAQLQWAEALSLPIAHIYALSPQARPFTPEGAPRGEYAFDGYVDALLGTGLRGAPDALTALLIGVPAHDLRPGRRPVVAVDIPSGMDGRTGACPGGACLRADVTVTFHAPKPGLYLTPRREDAGEIVIADIGLWDMDEDVLALDAPELSCQALLPGLIGRLKPRPLAAHKGDCGRVLIYAGSLGMAGAAAMCAQAAVAAGAGLTTVACPREIMPVLQILAPNAMCVEIGAAVRRPPAHDVLALGPGLGQSEEIWQNILALYNPETPSVWDADALNLLSLHPDFRLGENAVITPHPGEAARLLGWEMGRVLADRFGTAQALAEKLGCTALLKGDVTLLARQDASGPRFALSANGAPALAKGGSGDVLCGMLSALRPGRTPWEATALACVWHGLAGRAGEARYGQLELTSAQLIACLHAARTGERK